ncbi:MAG: hypothetical protein ACK56G_00005, partial [Pirellulaceae bacterium]
GGAPERMSREREIKRWIAAKPPRVQALSGNRAPQATKPIDRAFGQSTILMMVLYEEAEEEGA